MAVLMGVPRVGAEAEVEKIGTHVATETVPTRVAVEMAITIEAVDALAHAQEARTATIALEEIAGIVMK